MADCPICGGWGLFCPPPPKKGCSRCNRNLAGTSNVRFANGGIICMACFEQLHPSPSVGLAVQPLKRSIWRRVIDWFFEEPIPTVRLIKDDQR